jgi:hypothetical protein
VNKIKVENGKSTIAKFNKMPMLFVSVRIFQVYNYCHFLTFEMWSFLYQAIKTLFFFSSKKIKIFLPTKLSTKESIWLGVFIETIEPFMDIWGDGGESERAKKINRKRR